MAEKSTKPNGYELSVSSQERGPVSKPKQSNDSVRTTATQQLEEKTAILRLYSRRLIPALTIGSLLFSMIVAALSSARLSGALPFSFYLGLLCILTVILGITLYSLVSFHGLVRDGDNLFQFISNENEWYKQNAGGIDPQVKANSLHARRIQQQFSTNASLPLVSQKYGVQAYGLLNIGSYLTALLLLQLLFRPFFVWSSPKQLDPSNPPDFSVGQKK